MAMLEVHDGQGQVRREMIAREQPILFGSSPKCDLVLSGPGILPFHGRIRWRKGRYKVDASPDAEYLVVNGHKMTSASFHQGDEVEVGPCRIFLIQDDGDVPRGADDVTRFEPAPPAAAPKQFEEIHWTDLELHPLTLEKMQAIERAKRKPSPPADRPEPPEPLKRTNWSGLEVAPPSDEVPDPTLAPAPAAPRAPAKRPRSRPESAARAPKPAWGGLRDRLAARDQAPGRERVVTSPMVVGLVVTLAALVALGISLYRVIAQTTATRLYNRAVESLDDGDAPSAIKRFDDFLAANARDPRASKARVLRALATIRQFTTSPAVAWSNALEAERAMVASVGREPAYRDASAELAELILKTAEGLADRAKSTADAKVLAEADEAVALHAKVAGPAAGALLARSRVPVKLADARAAVRKAGVRARALALMDAALKAGSSSGVYAARDALVRQYADLAADRALIDRLTRANDLVRKAVAFDPTRRPAPAAPDAGPLGPATSLVLRRVEPGVPAGAGPVVVALADGSAYGLDGHSGAPLWQSPVGLSSPFPPQAVPGGATVLVFDARSDALACLDARTGAPIWRQDVGEAVGGPPLILGNQAVQATPGGKLLLIDLASGALQGTFDLGFPLTQTPVGDESGAYLYVLADRDCLFVLRRDPPECVAVEYLGHASGSIACPMSRLGRFLVVAENHTPAEGRWRIFLLGDDGAGATPVQEVAQPSWTWAPPASSGTVVWATGDRGDVAAYAVGDYDAAAPFRPLARIAPEAEPSGPAFALARSEHEVWIASARPSRLDLDVERGKIATAWALGETGPALAPIQVAGGLAVLTQQAADGPGVALWGVDPASGTVRWRTVLGAPWPVAPARLPDGDGLTTLGLDGRVLTLSPALLDAGGFLESPLPRPGDFRLPPAPAVRLEGEGLTVLVPGPDARHLLVRAGGGEFHRVELPSALAADPLIWGRALLIPGGDGLVSLVDPATGAPRAEPFAPAFDRDRPTRWRAPVALEGDAVALADDAGRVRRLVLAREPRTRLVVTAEVDLGARLASGPASTGGAIVLATADGRVRSLAARDLSPVGAWPLDAPLAQPPSSSGGRGFVADATGALIAFGPDGRRLWSSPSPGAAALGPPAILGDSAWSLARDGTLRRLALADGAPLDRIDLGILPVGNLLTAGAYVVVPVGPGSVRVLKTQSEGVERGESDKILKQ